MTSVVVTIQELFDSGQSPSKRLKSSFEECHACAVLLEYVHHLTYCVRQFLLQRINTANI